MTLLEIIRKKKFATATEATLATQTDKTQLTVAKVASVAVANCPDEKFPQIEIELIRAWLHKIGEPEEDHFIVLDKCKSEPEAMEYFLKHAQCEYESSYSVTDGLRHVKTMQPIYGGATR
ncbi:MAG: hypothetical protein H0X02_13565 [Nitrosomonas sp.]|nr:hypothetical protein [Nitrosomonas sp.]